MCLRTSSVRPTNRWNWDGDLILRDTTILARRRNPATDKAFPVDVREFLGTASNSVVRSALDDVVDGLTAREQTHFTSRAPGAFDLRARAVTGFLARTVKYAKRGRGAEDWLYPDETLDARSGDCEDLAFLLAAMLLASGVSGYVVRVAFGTVRELRENKPHDHAWVVYRDERGRWLLLDPLLSTQQAAAGAKSSRTRRTQRAKRYEYEPRFVFNDSHLWAMRPGRGVQRLDEYVDAKDPARSFDPKFAAGVHDMIFDEALAGMSWSSLMYVKSVSLAIDGDTFAYDPFDHFDNGYIERGWARVRERLATGDLGDFALASHSIADFYAHSSYGHFAMANGSLDPVDERTAGAGPASGNMPAYDSELFDFARFSRNEKRATMTRANAERRWAGKWISGRYAQPDDPAQGFFERALTPFPNDLEKPSEIGPRACLPHHNEIAVDKDGGGKVPDGHKLYTSGAQYAAQFAARKAAATAHVAAAYGRWKARGFDA